MSLLYTRIIHLIKERRKLLWQKGSPTGQLVSQWARIMVIPQFVAAPLSLCFGRYEGLMIFGARFVAMHIAYELDKFMPYTRAQGLCHLLTFGPLFIYFTKNYESIKKGWGKFKYFFVAQYAIITLCLYLDLRDLILYLCGFPFPCYVRDYHRLKLININDKRVEQPVTWFSTIFW